MGLRRFRFTTVSLFALACTLPASAQSPKLRLSEVQDIAPTGYRADLTLDPAKPRFSGTIEIALDIRKPTQTIWLNASKIKIVKASLSSGASAKAVPGAEGFLGLQFDTPLPAGKSKLTIHYTGEVQAGNSSGVFLTQDSGNRYILTQFESTDGRDAFPCFDEPVYKVPWQLTLRVPPGNSALSNTPIVSEETADGLHTYVFKETKPLPSYLIAFGVGPFEYVPAGFAGKNRAPVRIVTPQGRAHEAKYAAEVTAAILTRLENYFGIPFPYEKSDQVAVPVTVGFGAMENAGMVTYGQTIILAKPESDTLARQRGYASTAAHELAHQWFGDLVTTEWWNDIWLNEAFATWMEQKLIAEWKPEWNTTLDDVDAKLFAENQDSLITARKIRQPIETNDDIDNAFDGITYQKGAAVIGMFEHWMGAAEFRAGVQSYLKQYAFRNSTAPEFLDSLSSGGRRAVSQPFSTFLNQAGVPLVSVALDCGQRPPVLHLEQSRYLPVGSKGSADQTWQIPVCVRYGSGTNAGQTSCTLLSQPKADLALSEAKSCPEWVLANDQAKGYYRAGYEGGLLTALTHGDVTARLSGAERVDLLGNAQSLVASGKIPEAEALRMVEIFHLDPSRQVLERALTIATGPYRRAVPENLMPNYRRFMARNFGARAHELGWIPKPGEPDDVRLLRPTLLRTMATAGGDQQLADQARELADKWFNDHSAVSPDVLTAVLDTAAYYGNLDLFNRFLAEFKKTTDRQVGQRLIQAMGGFRDPAAVKAGLEAVVSGQLDLADGFPILVFNGQASHSTEKLPFEFVKAHFDQIMKGNPSVFGVELGSTLPNIGAGFCDAASRNELKAFFDPIVNKYTGAPRTLAQVLEGIDLCIAMKKIEEPSVAAFLKNY